MPRIADFKITSGNIRLDESNPNRCPWVIVQGTGPYRALQSQHRTLEHARKACAKYELCYNVVVVNRLDGKAYDTRADFY